MEFITLKIFQIKMVNFSLLHEELNQRYNMPANFLSFLKIFATIPPNFIFKVASSSKT